MIIKNGVGITTLKNGVAVKQALSAANETVAKGVYDATTLSAVDSDLAVDKIKESEIIFGFTGTVTPGGTETFEKYHAVDQAGTTAYTPSSAGIFSIGEEGGNLTVELQDSDSAWQRVSTSNRGFMSVVGDGTNLRFYNISASARMQTSHRYTVTTGTFSRYNSQDLGATTAYIPSVTGFFSHASESFGVDCELQYSAGVWQRLYLYTSGGGVGNSSLVLGNGADHRYYNADGAARWFVLMRAILQ